MADPHSPQQAVHSKLAISLSSLKVARGMKWLLNLFKGFVERRIKDSLNSRICDLVSSNIKETVDKALGSFPVTVPIDKVAKLSYALMKEPTFTPSMVVTDHKGEFIPVSSQSSTDIPFSPSPLSPSLPPLEEPESQRMVYLWVTDYLANSAGMVYMRAGILRYNITPDMIGDSGSFFKLNTKYFFHMIPKLYDAHPEKPLILGVRSTNSPPTIKITPQGAKLMVPSALDFYVVDEGGDVTLAFTLGMTVSLEIHPWIERGSDDNQLLIKANATYLDTEMSVHTSKIGDIGEKAALNIWSAVSVIFQMLVMPQINLFTNNGVPVPLVKGISFVEPKLSLGEGYVVIETDICHGQ